MSMYRKRILYGMMNFVDVRRDDCYFCDIYADTEVVRRNIGTTTLHKIVVVYRGMDMVADNDRPEQKSREL